MTAEQICFSQRGQHGKGRRAGGPKQVFVLHGPAEAPPEADALVPALVAAAAQDGAVAAALSHLRAAEDRADVDTVISDLWQIAVNVEDGVSADAKADLEAARKALEKADRKSVV